jgi:alpha/beta superfamily hydrolase
MIACDVRAFFALGYFHEYSQWVQPACLGAVAGAVALAFVGFSHGGWVTTSAKEKHSNDQTAEHVAQALMLCCAARSKDDPAGAAVLAGLKAATG